MIWFKRYVRNTKGTKYTKPVFFRKNMLQGGKYTVHRSDLLYPELSFRINGALFDVFRTLGGGHKETYYQRAVAESLKKYDIHFTEQRYVPLLFNGKIVGKYFLDFLVEEKIILELKRGKFVDAHIIEQVKQYMISLNIQLAIVACFTMHAVIPKRIVYIKD